MENTRTTYVLDTSALLSAGKKALHSYPDSDVVIPLAVVVELEKMKTDPLIGFVARSVLKTIEKLRSVQGNNIHKGVEVDNGSSVRVETNHTTNKSDIPESIKRRGDNDFLIMTVAKNLKEEGNTVVLVSNDLSMRILASVALDIPAEEYRLESHQGSYEGVYTAHCSKEVMDKLYKDKLLSSSHDLQYETPPTGKNSGVILRSSENGSALTYRDTKGTLHLISGRSAFNVHPRKGRQEFALNYLLDDNLPVVSLGGPAGTGKTLLALAAGLEKVLEERKYRKIVVFRPVTSVGNENLGYLPGTEEEKMSPWAGAIFDALEAIAPDKGALYQEIVNNRDILEILPVTHIRGRTFTNAYVIIDEAQNLEKNTLLSILSRAGEGTKTIFSWDAAQKDNLHIGKHDGIVAVVDRLKSEGDFAHITLDKSQRSHVAQMASEILEEF